MNLKIDMNICRVCLKPGEGTSIFTGDVAKKFQFTTLLQPAKNDGLPQQLCGKCSKRLQIASEFREQAEASDQHIRSFVTDVNKRFQQVTGDNDEEPEDELDAELQDIMQDETDQVQYEFIGGIDMPDTPRQQLVEILSSSGSPLDEKLQHFEAAEADEENYSNRQDIELYVIDANNMSGEAETYIEQDEEELTNEDFHQELANDDFDDEEYLEDEESTTTELAELEMEEDVKEPVKRTRKPAASNPHNRCDKCDKMFSTRTNLTRHMITHEGKKPYICKICGNSFTQNGSLKSHMFIHTGERPYECNICTKAFTQSKSLTFHMRRHTGEKPFQCNYCQVKFRQKDGLKRHIAARHSSHKGRHHECDVCHKVLLSRNSLTVHRRKHTEAELDTCLAEMKDESGESETKYAEGIPQ